MANPNTSIGLGIMRDISGLGMRSFEDDQTSPTQYISQRDNLDFIATSDGALVQYDVGSNLPFDVGGTSYSATAVALLQRYWDAGFCYPAT